MVRETSRTSIQPVRSMTMSLPIDIVANRTSATMAKTTPGLATGCPRSPPSNATPVRMTPRVAGRARAPGARQRFAAEHHREDHGEPAVGRDHAADDRDRSDRSPVK